MGRGSNLILISAVGLVLSFLGNIILTTVTCFALGIFLEQRNKPKKKITTVSRTIPIQKTIRCQTCGVMLPSNARFCSECGTKTVTLPSIASTKSARRYRPEEIRSKLETIEDSEKYLHSIRDLLMIDEWGRYWSIGMQTSNWYVYQQGDWNIDQPTSDLRIIKGDQSFLQSQPPHSICPKCSDSIVPGSLFCKRCGSPVTAPQHYTQERYTAEVKDWEIKRTSIRNPCPFCGSDNDPSDIFCVICGRPIRS